MKETVYIGIGSNIGDRLQTLLDCLQKLDNMLSSMRISSIWETEPMIVKDQPEFLNMAVSGSTADTPEKLLKALWEIEDSAGRNREKEVSKGPRPLDLDILLYGNSKIHSEILVIPHPAIRERGFVLMPLKELNPELKEPESGTLYSDFLIDVENQGIICYKSSDQVERLLKDRYGRKL